MTEDHSKNKEAESTRIPKRIQEKIDLLRSIETRLGHLPPDEWSLKELSSRISDPHMSFQSSQLEQQTELLFGDICDELKDIGFTSAQIASAINSQLRYDGGPNYCNAAEVSESLGDTE